MSLASQPVPPAPPAARRRFGIDWIGEFLPHYLADAPSRLHADLATDLADFHMTRGQRLNRIAPRGSAKTTWLSKAYPLYVACENIEPLTLLLAETGPQSEVYLSAVKDELTGNADLAAAYPGACGEGPVWRADRIVLRNGATIVARGSGGRILGLTKGANRPTLVIGDDLNQRLDAYSPTTRTRRYDWFVRDAMNVGSPRTNFIAAGTPIHRGAVVCELARVATWHTKSYRSVIRWPDRTDLWEAWERILTNMANPNRVADARAYYDAHQADMDAGAEVLWPDREPLYALMCLRAEVGPAAFASEKQDDPGAGDAAEWPPSYFDYPGFWFDEWPADLVLRVGFYDSAGEPGAKPGDYHAFVLCGLDSAGGLWMDAKLWRGPGSEAVAEVDRIARDPRFPLAWVGVETNFGGAMLVPMFHALHREMAAAGGAGLFPLPLKGVMNVLPKPTRIRRADPYLSRRQIRVRNTPGGQMLVNQWRDFPSGDHDDGPDAADGCLELIRAAFAGG